MKSRRKHQNICFLTIDKISTFNKALADISLNHKFSAELLPDNLICLQKKHTSENPSMDFLSLHHLLHEPL